MLGKFCESMSKRTPSKQTDKNQLRSRSEIFSNSPLSINICLLILKPYTLLAGGVYWWRSYKLCVIAEDCELYTELFVREFFLRWKAPNFELFPCLLQELFECSSKEKFEQDIPEEDMWIWLTYVEEYTPIT